MRAGIPQKREIVDDGKHGELGIGRRDEIQRVKQVQPLAADGAGEGQRMGPPVDFSNDVDP
jgi:hypothetical protein